MIILRISFLSLLAFVAILLGSCSPAVTTHQLSPSKNGEYVILLHGLARSPESMQPLARELQNAGYGTCVTGYPSRSYTVPQLSERALTPALQKCRDAGAQKIHFIGHSMGAMIARYHLAYHSPTDVGKLVQLAPPNQGSEVVDHLSCWNFFEWINGPAGSTLGTGEYSLASQLSPLSHPTLVVAGYCSINPINSLMIPGPDDGKVSVKNTQAKGVARHVVIKTSHPMIMKNRQAIQETKAFLMAK